MGHSFIKTGPDVYKEDMATGRVVGSTLPHELGMNVVSENVGVMLQSSVDIQFDESWEELTRTYEMTNGVSHFTSIVIDETDYVQGMVSEQIQRKFSDADGPGEYKVIVSVYAFDPSYYPRLFRTGGDKSGYRLKAHFPLQTRLTIRSPTGRPIMQDVIAVGDPKRGVAAQAVYGNKHRDAATAITKVLFTLMTEEMCNSIAARLRTIS